MGPTLETWLNTPTVIQLFAPLNDKNFTLPITGFSDKIFGRTRGKYEDNGDVVLHQIFYESKIVFEAPINPSSASYLFFEFGGEKFYRWYFKDQIDHFHNYLKSHKK